MVEETGDRDAVSFERLRDRLVARDRVRLVVVVEEQRVRLHALRERAQLGRGVTAQQREVAASRAQIVAQRPQRAEEHGDERRAYVVAR